MANVIQQKRHQRYQSLHIARLNLQIPFVFGHVAFVVRAIELSPLHCRPANGVLEGLKHPVPVFTAVTLPAQHRQARRMPPLNKPI